MKLITKTELKEELKNLPSPISLGDFMKQYLGKNIGTISKYKADEPLPRIYSLELFYLKHNVAATKIDKIEKIINNKEH